MYRQPGDIDTTSDHYTPCEITRKPRGTAIHLVAGQWLAMFYALLLRPAYC